MTMEVRPELLDLRRFASTWFSIPCTRWTELSCAGGI